MNKHCPTCKTDKPLDRFWKGQYLCIDCQKIKQKTVWQSRSPKKRLEQHLKYKYGITHAEFSKAWDEQNGCCAICKQELPDLMTYENRRRGYAIDHNHETSEFRGILCINCNSVLGLARDSIEVLQSAIVYLQSKGSYGLALVDNMRAARKK
jgi:uncharacterized Zn finger protein (UPF0148 family)